MSFFYWLIFSSAMPTTSSLSTRACHLPVFALEARLQPRTSASPNRVQRFAPLGKMNEQRFFCCLLSFHVLASVQLCTCSFFSCICFALGPSFLAFVSHTGFHHVPDVGCVADLTTGACVLSFIDCFPFSHVLVLIPSSFFPTRKQVVFVPTAPQRRPARACTTVT